VKPPVNDPRPRRGWLAPAVGVGVGMLAALLLPVFFGHVVVPLVVLGTVVLMAGLGWWVAATMYRNGVTLGEESPLRGLDRADRRTVRRAIRHDDPLPAELAEVALRTARQIVGHAPLLYLGGGFFLLEAVNMVHLAGRDRWVGLGLAVLAVGFALFLGLELRRARRYVRRADAADAITHRAT
jgi:hypothetical protein